MNEVMAIKRKYEEQEDWFMPLFRSDEIKARRAARMRRDAQEAAKARSKQQEAKAREERKRKLEAKHQQEVADTAASVAGGLTMAASLLALAMLV